VSFDNVKIEKRLNWFDLIQMGKFDRHERLANSYKRESEGKNFVQLPLGTFERFEAFITDVQKFGPWDPHIVPISGFLVGKSRTRQLFHRGKSKRSIAKQRQEGRLEPVELVPESSHSMVNINIFHVDDIDTVWPQILQMQGVGARFIQHFGNISAQILHSRLSTEGDTPDYENDYVKGTVFMKEDLPPKTIARICEIYKVDYCALHSILPLPESCQEIAKDWAVFCEGVTSTQDRNGEV